MTSHPFSEDRGRDAFPVGGNLGRERVGQLRLDDDITDRVEASREPTVGLLVVGRC